MKYFIDTEFIEGFHKPLFGKRRHFIDLISIGIVAEDGREYYAVSNDFDNNDAGQWVKDNVLYPIEIENYKSLPEIIKRQEVIGRGDRARKFLLRYGAIPISQIASEIIEFVSEGLDDLIYKYTRHDCWQECYYPKEFEYVKKHNTFLPSKYYSSGFNGDGYAKNRKLIYNQPEFYGYYCDYDWVLFCSLFGTMMDLPKGFPMYCIDLKQTLEEVRYKEPMIFADNQVPEHTMTYKHHSDGTIDFISGYFDLTKQPNFPKQINEHNALADARWNKELYCFIK